MQRSFCIFCWAVCASPFLAVQSAQAQFESDYLEGVYGWYEAGPSLVDNAKLEDYFGMPAAGSEIKFDPGFHFGIGIGREFTPYFKAEVESGFNYNEVDSITGASISNAKLYRVPVMANVALQLPNRTGLVPVVGAGVGGEWLEFDAENVTIGAISLTDRSDTWTFSYQGFAGVRYEFADRFNLGLFYRYNVADGPSWNYEELPGSLKLNSVRSHSISLTFGWYY